jgi:hypothetical protein
LCHMVLLYRILPALHCVSATWCQTNCLYAYTSGFTVFCYRIFSCAALWNCSAAPRDYLASIWIWYTCMCWPRCNVGSIHLEFYTPPHRFLHCYVRWTCTCIMYRPHVSSWNLLYSASRSLLPYTLLILHVCLCPSYATFPSCCLFMPLCLLLVPVSGVVPACWCDSITGRYLYAFRCR